VTIRRRWRRFAACLRATGRSLVTDRRPSATSRPRLVATTLRKPPPRLGAEPPGAGAPSEPPAPEAAHPCWSRWRGGWHDPSDSTPGGREGVRARKSKCQTACSRPTFAEGGASRCQAGQHDQSRARENRQGQRQGACRSCLPRARLAVGCCRRSQPTACCRRSAGYRARAGRLTGLPRVASVGLETKLGPETARSSDARMTSDGHAKVPRGCSAASSPTRHIQCGASTTKAPRFAGLSLMPEEGLEPPTRGL
jgi:hypothetical protein